MYRNPFMAMLVFNVKLRGCKFFRNECVLIAKDLFRWAVVNWGINPVMLRDHLSSCPTYGITRTFAVEPRNFGIAPPISVLTQGRDIISPMWNHLADFDHPKLVCVRGMGFPSKPWQNRLVTGGSSRSEQHFAAQSELR